MNLAQSRRNRVFRASAICLSAGTGFLLALAFWMTPDMTQRTFAQAPAEVKLPAADTRIKAPDFPADFKWLGTDQQLTLAKELRGRVVVLDFWTYCCINCMHVLPDLAYLEHKYADQPVSIIGVHSAKFENEQDPVQVAQAMRRYRIRHPVIVDEKMQLWGRYNVRAWPTFVIIDSAGRVVGQASGEGKRELLDNVISQLLVEGDRNGTLAKVAKAEISADTPKHSAAHQMTTLSYPGKIISDGKRLFIADSNHDRIVICELDGKVQQIIGSGKPCFADGTGDAAMFFNPQGMAISSDGMTLYVADTNNHAVRRIDLKTSTVTTLAGNGTQGNDRRGGNVGNQQPLSSPWDVVCDEKHQRLIVAMAGLHQIWTVDIKTGHAAAWIGSGREDIDTGPRAQPARLASLAQTSGLSIEGDRLYFADSETSSIRRAELATGDVTTLIGTGLFDFGLRDGALNQAMLQHPLGVAASDHLIYVADTYNHALRVIDTQKQTITTLIPAEIAARSPLNEPGGLCIVGQRIFIADTNHHRIMRYDLTTRKLEPVTVLDK